MVQHLMSIGGADPDMISEAAKYISNAIKEGDTFTISMERGANTRRDRLVAALFECGVYDLEQIKWEDDPRRGR